MISSYKFSASQELIAQRAINAGTKGPEQSGGGGADARLPRATGAGPWQTGRIQTDRCEENE